MFIKSLTTEFEKMDTNAIRKLIFGYSILPALSVFVLMFLIDPSMIEHQGVILFAVMGVLTLYVISIIIIFGSLMGYLSIEVLKPNIREKLVKIVSPLVASSLAHDKEIRKEVVKGIVSDISDEMKRPVNYNAIEKMQLDIEKITNSLVDIQDELKNRKEK